jgi:hypothetical protein
MKIALVDVDSKDFPNLALMKIAQYHKSIGDDVDWYFPLFMNPDKIYASKVFTFTPDYIQYSPNDPEPIKGGTGYDLYSKLPEEIDKQIPDYSIYPNFKEAIGFLSRGCIRSCPWCIVPKKEGNIYQYDDISNIYQNRKNVILLDNNFLANDINFIEEQTDKMKYLKLKVDFNQGLDARLVDEHIAKILTNIKFIRYIRFACDTMSMLPHIKNAIQLLRNYNYTGEIFIYTLAKDLNETHERIIKLLEIDNKIVPFCQPFRDFNTTGGQVINTDLKKLARWCNRSAIRKSCSFQEYTKHFK